MTPRATGKRGPGRPKGQEPPTTQVSLRFPDGILKRVDRYLSQMRISVPGVTLTRADAIRSLVVTGLDATDRKDSDPPRGATTSD